MDPPYTKHRVMMASCITGQMAWATKQIMGWDDWEKRVKHLQRQCWANNLVWLQRHLIRVQDDPRMRRRKEDAPELDPFDHVREWVELGSATYLTIRDTLWADSQVD